jgi:alpha-glucosidase
MAGSSLLRALALLPSILALPNGQTTSYSADGLGPSPQSSTTASATVASTEINGTPTSFRSVFTIPASADEGANVLPNLEDPQAVDAQEACPGYKASQVHEDAQGLSAILTLAGKPCNLYGTDVKVLNLKVEYQATNRLAINISPALLV